jgi:hypothetical protein
MRWIRGDGTSGALREGDGSGAAAGRGAAGDPTKEEGGGCGACTREEAGGVRGRIGSVQLDVGRVTQ